MNPADKLSKKEQALILKLSNIVWDHIGQGQEVDEERVAEAMGALVVVISAMLCAGADDDVHLRQGVEMAASEISRTCMRGRDAPWFDGRQGEVVN